MQITVTFDAELLERVDAAARAVGLSRSAFIRMRTAGGAVGDALPPVAPAQAAPATPAGRPTRGHSEEPPAGYYLVTVEEQDLGKDAWMSPSDAGIA